MSFDHSTDVGAGEITLKDPAQLSKRKKQIENMKGQQSQDLGTGKL